MVEADREIVITALKKRGDGSFLRGWRRELDPDGSLDVSFLDFCKAASRLRFQVDALRLFGEESPKCLALQWLAPVEGEVVNRFRQWVSDQFGGPAEMFMVFEPPDLGGKLTRELFCDQCMIHGFDADREDLIELFNLLDANCTGSIELEDVSFLDTDEKRREGAIEKARMKRQYAHEHLLTQVYRENRLLKVPISHRLAPRNWHAPAFDFLPEVVIEKRMNWQRTQEKRTKEAVTQFHRHLQHAFGNAVRAWRRGLDPGCTFSMTRTELARYCRTVNLDCDIGSLWHSLDRDSDGVLYLEDVASKAAASLANFWYWVRKNDGTCVGTWDRVMAVARPPSSWKSTSSLPFGTFTRALKRLGWPTTGGDSEAAGTALCNALDLYGCAIVCRTDLAWLDRWSAPDWLCREADPQAWAAFSSEMRQVWGRPLRQWRAMDVDSSNEVTWAEFESMCEQIGFSGNRGGVWRHLDKNLNGYIRLADYHEPSNKILMSFKEWVDTNFGSVEFAFKSMDSDGSSSLTFSEWKRACKRLAWKGDVRNLFICLDIEVNPPGSLSYNELAFLDSWSPLPQVSREARSPSHSTSSTSTPDRNLQKSHSAPSFAAPRGAGRRLPDVRRRDHFPVGLEHDPLWFASKKSSHADIIAAFRTKNEQLRDKAKELQAEQQEIRKQATVRAQNVSHFRQLNQTLNSATLSMLSAELEDSQQILADSPMHRFAMTA